MKPRLTILALSSLFSVVPVLAETAPESALLFKSGQAALTRTIPLERGSRSTQIDLPISAHGTVWLEAEGAEIRHAVARRELRGERRVIGGVADLLRAAVGQPVTLELGSGESLSGRLSRFLGGGSGSGSLGRMNVIGPPAHVAVEIESHVRVIPVARVTGVTVDAELPGETWNYERPVYGQTLEVDWVEPVPSRRAKLRLRNLAGGLAWAPSYELRLGEDGVSRLIGKAVVINDLEDLDGTDLKLVIGFPNLEHAEIDTALSPMQSLVDWVAAIDGQSGQRVGRHSALLNQAGGFSIAGSGGALASIGASLPGDATEDLYLYEVGPLTLARGERAYVPLSDQTIQVAHRFDWTLPPRVSNERFVTTEEVDPPVWHLLELPNGGSAPWTTAPILIVGAAGPLAQSRLHYTAPGSETSVRLTQALDIAGSAVEQRVGESLGERETVRLGNSTYERIEVVGRLELVNRSERSAPMRIVQSLRGDLLSADHTPRLESPVNRVRDINATRSLTWEFDLASGDDWSANYRYEVLIRR